MKLSRAYNVARTVLVLLFVTLLVFMAVFGLRLRIGWLGIDIDQKGLIEEDAVSLGLDLAGGTSVVFEVVPKDGQTVTADGLEDTRSILEKRVNNPEASVYIISDTEIQLDIPGYDDPRLVVDQFGKSGALNFRNSDGEVLMDYKAVEKATFAFQPVDDASYKPVVQLTLTSAGEKLFANITETIAKKTSGNNYLAIYVGDELISQPTVEEKITGDSVVITSPSFEQDKSEAERLASYINAGVMQYELKCDDTYGSMSYISATLGEEALDTSVTAALIGLILVMLFMIIMYRVAGIVASISLCAYTSIVVLCIITFGVTLTLPGIAGIILSIGMAVDANVVIFERVKEEIRTGKSVKSASEAGFKKALSAIIDSNVTTAIAALVLVFIGNGMVKGFGITLFIGVVVSVITAFFLSKGILRLFIGMGFVKPGQYCPKVKGGNN